MTNRRKLITKKELIKIAWEIGEFAMTHRDSIGLTDAVYGRNWHGNWCDFTLGLLHDDFHVWDGFVRHGDGRIRDRSCAVENPLAFAQWFVLHFPEHSEAIQLKERMRNPRLVAATIEDQRLRTAFKRVTKGMEIIDDLNVELTLAKVAA